MWQLTGNWWKPSGAVGSLDRTRAVRTFVLTAAQRLCFRQVERPGGTGGALGVRASTGAVDSFEPMRAVRIFVLTAAGQLGFRQVETMRDKTYET